MPNPVALKICDKPVASPVLLVVLIFAGLAGNYFNYPILLDINFLFGSIAAMLILQIHGSWWGIGATVVISSYTYFLWNHPYAIIVTTAEVAAVACLTRRYRYGFVLADTMFWLLCGLPLVWFFYGYIMEAANSLYITMIKQALNGITNTLIARLLFSAISFKSSAKLLPVREIGVNILSSFILFPTLLILMISSWQDYREMDLGIKKALEQSSNLATTILQSWLNDRRYTIIHLADQIRGDNVALLQNRLDQLRATDGTIERCGVFDKNANIVAYSPLVNETGAPKIGKNFADRRHGAVVKKTLQPTLSEVFLGRVGTPRPIVAMVAPILVNGQYDGYVSGTFRIDQLRRVLDTSINGELSYILIDQGKRVIVTNHRDQQIMQPLERSAGKEEKLALGLTRFIPEFPENTTISERWKQSLYIAKTSIGSSAEWTLIVEQPIAPHQKVLYDRYAGKLISLFLVLLAGLLIAELVSRRIVATTEKLSRVTRNLPEKLEGDGPVLVWPTSRVDEIDQLIANFRGMADSLQSQFAKVQEANTTLEHRVDERTQELRDSRNLFRTLADYAPVGIFQTDSIGNCIFVNKKWCELSGLNEMEALGKGWIAALHPDDRQRIIGEWTETVRDHRHFFAEHRFISPAGEICWVEVNAIQFFKEESGENNFIGCVVDITERKKATAEMRLAVEAAVLADEDKSRLLTTVGHEFRTPLTLLATSLDILDRYGKDLSPEELDAQGKYIRSASNQMKELVKTILSYSSREERFGPDEESSAPIGPLCRTISEEISSAFSCDHNFQLQVSAAVEQIPVRITPFRRILGNLLLNAFQYTTSGGSISLTADRQQDRLQVSVIDQGLGISPVDQEHVFESFYRGENVESRRGMGLGLSIVRDAVAQLNGQITLTSTLGVGTTIRVDLPITPQQPA